MYLKLHLQSWSHATDKMFWQVKAELTIEEIYVIIFFSFPFLFILHIWDTVVTVSFIALLQGHCFSHPVCWIFYPIVRIFFK